MPSLTFSLLSFGNLLAIYRKQTPCLSKALTYCFMRPSLIWRGGSTTFEDLLEHVWKCFYAQVFTIFFEASPVLSSNYLYLCYPIHIKNRETLYIQTVGLEAY